MEFSRAHPIARRTTAAPPLFFTGVFPSTAPPPGASIVLLIRYLSRLSGARSNVNLCRRGVRAAEGVGGPGARARYVHPPNLEIFFRQKTRDANYQKVALTMKNIRRALNYAPAPSSYPSRLIFFFPPLSLSFSFFSTRTTLHF